MNYSLGIDIGSVSVKLALIDSEGKIVQLDSERITSSPRQAFSHVISRLADKFNLSEISTSGVSGSGKGIIPPELNWTEYSSSLSIASGILRYYPDARAIIQIGGQNSLVIELEDGLKKPWKVSSNPLCAAGTGRFLEQQAYRLRLSMEDFTRLALKCTDSPPRIAARCSVFAKSDLIHLQQKGVSIETMLFSLCGSTARMVVSLKKGVFEEPVYLVGGVAANQAIAQSLNEILSARNGHPVQVIIPENYLYIEAIGTALLARVSGKTSRVVVLPEVDVRQRYFEMPRLEKVTQQNLWVGPAIDKPFTAYLGVDVGSTSTKAVIINESGKVMAKHYLMTAGRPIQAVKEVFRNLLPQVSDHAHISGVGVTGSGRYLVGSFIGADLIKNEITAQARAAAEIDPEADIIEIGGQDSKLVIKRNGVVVDYQMNKACAAGTGSFIDELAELLDVSVKNGEFAALAFQAPHTIDLGTRCAAFMGQAVACAQQEGVPLEVITASLSKSIAGNYLSKVVGTRRLGDRVILTGAVFYNEAIVSAFQQALGDRTTLVPEHKEVTGAIGAALLAKESMAGKASRFKGFQEVVASEPALSTFTCKICDNNCTITRMQLPGEKPTFYGSRCDLFDSTLSQEKRETPFDERERLLLKEYKEGAGTGPTVGIPRSLMVFDFAPLLIGFLNALGARVVLSSKTNKQIMEQAVELGYTDSCFPIKLLHGHVASLENVVDYILYPSAIRLGPKEGDENQKYACPLVQASPYIINQVLDLEKKLLIPTIDFSLGDKDVINNLMGVARRMGFSRRRGKQAALAGLNAQRSFEVARAVVGQRLLDQIRENNQLGVVLFSRSYMSQDSGANLGIAEKLAQLGVVPIPLDFLPLETIDVKRYTDRPYWSWEGKHIAGAAITAQDPGIYGLILTNFGCGPNSFILPIVEDIMGSKPLGELEIDEHAAEAGIVTRLEAFVDTIMGFSRSSRAQQLAGPGKDISRGVPASIDSRKTILIPRMSPHAEVLAATFEAFGARAMVLPEPDERNLLYADRLTSGKECLPYRVTLGDFLRFFYENGHSHIDPGDVAGFQGSAFGPCRFGKYAIEQVRILRELGFDLPMRTTVSNNAYYDMNLGRGFEPLVWRGIVAVDCLQRALWRTRPYEKSPGAANQLFNEHLAKLADRIRRRADFTDVLLYASYEFKSLIDPGIPRKPVVGINGEIYLRSNTFSNSNLVLECERAGLEVVVSSVGEWINYIQYRNIEDSFKEKNLKKMLKGGIRKLVLRNGERSVAGNFSGLLPQPVEATTRELLDLSSHVLSPKCGSEAVLSIGSGIEWMESRDFAGVISVMPHGCMPGGIVASVSEKLSALFGKPWISLTYDGFLETNNLARINEFAEVLKFCARDSKRGA